MRRMKTVLFALIVNGISTLHAAGLNSPAIQPVELNRMLEDDSSPQIIDVRSPDEFSAGHIPGSINIPAPLISKRIDELTQVDGLVLYCNDSRFTKVAEQLLLKGGVQDFSHLDGGLIAWEKELLPIVTSLK